MFLLKSILVLAISVCPCAALFFSSSPRVNINQQKIDLLLRFKSLKKNGKDTPVNVRKEIDLQIAGIEKFNPTKKPARDGRMNGFWRYDVILIDCSPRIN